MLNIIHKRFELGITEDISSLSIQICTLLKQHKAYDALKLYDTIIQYEDDCIRRRKKEEEETQATVHTSLTTTPLASSSSLSSTSHELLSPAIHYAIIIAARQLHNHVVVMRIMDRLQSQQIDLSQYPPSQTVAECVFHAASRLERFDFVVDFYEWIVTPVEMRKLLPAQRNGSSSSTAAPSSTSYSTSSSQEPASARVNDDLIPVDILDDVVFKLTHISE